MIVGRWYAQLAAVWHWYLPLCIYITVFNFIVYLSIFFFFNLVSINSMEWSVIPTCPSLMCSFSRSDTEETNSSKMCV